MQVKLISYTQEAENLLIFTKSTRLEMSPALMDDIRAWSPERKAAEIEYISRSIPSSHEFVDYTFLITGVTRAFTHQFVRTRHGSYAQQTMRVLNVTEGFDYATGPSVVEHPVRHSLYAQHMEFTKAAYAEQVRLGAAIEDARGVLPTNILTNIVAKFNLRTLSEMKLKRSGVRSQDEYRQVLQAMAEQVYAVHPWAELFLEPKQSDVVEKLEALAVEVRSANVQWSNEIQKSADMLKTRELS